MQYQTPGVYVEEISLLPPSVVEVATAIPAFIGYTQTALDENGAEQAGVVVKRINTFKDYTDTFGGALLTQFEAEVSSNPVTGTISISLEARESDGTTVLGTLPEFLMYYALKQYFDNGGGSCYIVSIGRYGSSVPSMEVADFEAGLAEIRRVDEPTLLVLVDAVHLAADYTSLGQQVLAQCGDLKDRFGLFDVLEPDSDAGTFRNGIGINNLKYGAAYTPYLRTGQLHAYAEDGVDIAGYQQGVTDTNGLFIGHLDDGGAITPAVSFAAGGGADIEFTVDAGTGALTISNLDTPRTPAEIVSAWSQVEEQTGYILSPTGDGTATVNETATLTFANVTLEEIESSFTQLHNQLKVELGKQRVVLPPSSAIAGVYARVDRERGVWKAPANVSLNNVLEPLVKIDNNEQGRLNIDPVGGKSVNAIRSFAGKGVLVWGARTLAGNDNEWRYINVRRLFNLIEESVQKSTSFVVFEPNDATTWLKVKALIESYLYGLWQRGALAGPTPEAAYVVNIGLGKTMTTQDVLEGRLIVEIGVAAVRPAEFIILRFFHKLQEA